MPKQKPLPVSVVIPCYNEQDNIEACLLALSVQSVKPLEIIVVDNNCTDRTVAIAQRHKAIKVVKETKQGLIPARNSGMRAARGEVIARIDAESRVAPDWIETMLKLFKDQKTQAVTGTGYFYDAPFREASKTVRNFFAVRLNRLILGHEMLWGSNMALHRSCWLNVHRELCTDPGIMEDLDLAAHISENFGPESIKYCADLRADISARRAMVSLKRNYLYLRMWPRTLKRHNYFGVSLLWPVIGFLLIAGLPTAAAIRLYNQDRGRMVLSRHQWRSKTLFDRPNP